MRFLAWTPRNLDDRTVVVLAFLYLCVLAVINPVLVAMIPVAVLLFVTILAVALWLRRMGRWLS